MRFALKRHRLPLKSRTWGLISRGTCAVLCSLPIGAFALGVRVPNQDAEATARGNAFVATANNPSAIYYNPAGISQLDGVNAQFGVHAISINSEYRSSSGAQAETKFEIQGVPQAFYTYTPKDSQLSYGLGIYAPFGLGLEWDADNPFRTSAIEGRLVYVCANPVIAWKPHSTLSLAIGPTFNYSRLKLRQGIFTATDEFRFRGDGFGFGFNAGVLYQPHPQWSFGASYRSASSIDYGGHSELRPYAASTHTSIELQFPQYVIAGISYRPTPDWNLEVNVDWTDWDRINSTSFRDTAFGNIPLPLNWKSSFLCEAGATRYLKNGYWVAGGYFFSGNSTSDENFTPIVPDTDLHVGSVGFGRKGEHWRWALSAQIIAGGWREVSNNVNPAVNGRYQWFNQAVNATIGYHF
jgi:long-chain fatty acid transport protein